MKFKICKICDTPAKLTNSRVCEKCSLEREDIMVTLRQQGLTYQTIGETLGVSRQRVEQVISEIAPHLKGHMTATRKALS